MNPNASNKSRPRRRRGPHTRRGKARSAANATRHGLRSGQTLLPSENRTFYTILTAFLIELIAPTAAEPQLSLARRLADVLWKWLRLFLAQQDAQDLLACRPSHLPRRRVARLRLIPVAHPSLQWDDLERFKRKAAASAETAIPNSADPPSSKSAGRASAGPSPARSPRRSARAAGPDRRPSYPTLLRYRGALVTEAKRALDELQPLTPGLDEASAVPLSRDEAADLLDSLTLHFAGSLKFQAQGLGPDGAASCGRSPDPSNSFVQALADPAPTLRAMSLETIEAHIWNSFVQSLREDDLDEERWDDDPELMNSFVQPMATPRPDRSNAFVQSPNRAPDLNPMNSFVHPDGAHPPHGNPDPRNSFVQPMAPSRPDRSNSFVQSPNRAPDPNPVNSFGHPDGAHLPDSKPDPRNSFVQPMAPSHPDRSNSFVKPRAPVPGTPRV